MSLFDESNLEPQYIKTIKICSHLSSLKKKKKNVVVVKFPGIWMITKKEWDKRELVTADRRRRVLTDSGVPLPRNLGLRNGRCFGMLLVEATTYYHRHHQPPLSRNTSSRPTRVVGPYPTLFHLLSSRMDRVVWTNEWNGTGDGFTVSRCDRNILKYYGRIQRGISNTWSFTPRRYSPPPPCLPLFHRENGSTKGEIGTPPEVK